VKESRFLTVAARIVCGQDARTTLAVAAWSIGQGAGAPAPHWRSGSERPREGAGRYRSLTVAVWIVGGQDARTTVAVAVRSV
jgi:hypothetical protein